MKFFTTTLFIILILSGCTNRSKSPEGALQDYIQGASSQEQRREFFLDRTTGKLQTAIESMDEEEFTEFAAMSGVERVKFEILHKNCQELRCFITYEVEYRQKFEQNEEFESVSKKIAELVQDGDQWKIADVTNIKSYIDSKTPIKIGPEDSE